MLDAVMRWAIDAVYSFGYAGVFFLTALGNMNLLIPTQLTLPFAGFLVGLGRFSFVAVLAASTAGSVAGSLLLYLLGLWSGEGLRRRFGKLGFKPNLARARKMFARRGAEAILAGRFVPGTGAPISLLAGLERMPAWRFTVYTALGSALWNGVFIGLGWALGARWALVKQYATTIEYTMLATLIAGVSLWYLWGRWRGRGHPKWSLLRRRGSKEPPEVAGGLGTASRGDNQ